MRLRTVHIHEKKKIHFIQTKNWNKLLGIYICIYSMIHTCITHTIHYNISMYN